MIGFGNQDVDACISNLLKTEEGEVPFSRQKGLTPGILDLPSTEVEQAIRESADENIDTYEPRVDSDDVELDITMIGGQASIKVTVTESEEEE
ncbi:MAG: hypothetical protein K6E75_03575 [Lachnospiraceae bacterium]|nr:hypothetical protein [Lachnospiraceae bacterium]